MEFSRQEYWSSLHSLLQGIFLTQGLNPGFLHCRQILYHLSHQGSPVYKECTLYAHKVATAAAKSLHSCPTLCDPIDSSPLSSSVPGILQARKLEWLPYLPPGDLPNPGIEPRFPALQADSVPSELPGKCHLVAV